MVRYEKLGGVAGTGCNVAKSAVAVCLADAGKKVFHDLSVTAAFALVFSGCARINYDGAYSSSLTLIPDERKNATVRFPQQVQTVTKAGDVLELPCSRAPAELLILILSLAPKNNALSS